MIDKEGDGDQAGAQEAVVSVEGDTPAVDPKIEAEAKEMGWKPKEAWKGDPEGWRPAEEFVKRGKEILPIVTRKLKDTEAALAKLKTDTAETIARSERMNATALRMQREQLESRYEALKLRAVEQGDTKGYAAAQQAQQTALKAVDKEIEEAKKPPAKGKDDEQPGGKLNARDQAIMSEWLDDNTWFGKDRVLRAAADDYFDQLEDEMPGASLATRLEEVKSRVEAEFPARFGKKPRNGAAMVEGANGRGPEGGSSSDGGQWAKVPQEVRGTARTQIEEEGLFNHLVGAKPGAKLTPVQLKAAREAWAEQYFTN